MIINHEDDKSICFVCFRARCCGSKFMSRCGSVIPICEVTTTTSQVAVPGDPWDQPATIYVVQAGKYFAKIMKEK